MVKNEKLVELDTKICDCFLEYTNFKDDLIEYKCLCSDKNYQKKFYGNLKERFSNYLTKISLGLF